MHDDNETSRSPSCAPLFTNDNSYTQYLLEQTHGFDNILLVLTRDPRMKPIKYDEHRSCHKYLAHRYTEDGRAQRHMGSQPHLQQSSRTADV